MQRPNPAETIVAVSSQWRASSVGVLRLSGDAAFALAAQVAPRLSDLDTARRAGALPCRVALDANTSLPARAIWFRAPHTYTGQDIVEFHVPGNLSLLRMLSDQFLAAGARRAWPGEFTARAYANGRLDSPKVDAVYALIHAADAAQARLASRVARHGFDDAINRIANRLTDLLARLEAGIDFADEDDMTFIAPHELHAALGQLLTAVRTLHAQAHDRAVAARPHVALVGKPNAGKSTLFNALLGLERALVAPVLGTTRDVLSAELEIEGAPLVLQDCAGLGPTATEIELAAHVAAERTAQQADIVLWLHEAATEFNAAESSVLAELADASAILVWSKCDDRTPRATELAAPFVDQVSVSVAADWGLNVLRSALRTQLRRQRAAGESTATDPALASVAASLERAATLAASVDAAAGPPEELLAVELREAHGRLVDLQRGPLAEDVLSRIYSQFCVGK